VDNPTAFKFPSNWIGSDKIKWYRLFDKEDNKVISVDLCDNEVEGWRFEFKVGICLQGRTERGMMWHTFSTTVEGQDLEDMRTEWQKA